MNIFASSIINKPNAYPWKYSGDLNSSSVKNEWVENSNFATISNSTTSATKDNNSITWTYNKQISKEKGNESQVFAKITGQAGYFRGFSPSSSGDSTGIQFGRTYAFNSNASNLKQVKNIDIEINLY